MFRYVAVLWCSETEKQERASEFIASRLKSAQWQEAMHIPGMRVFQTGLVPEGLTTHVLPHHSGTIIGRTFATASDVFDQTPVGQWSGSESDTDAIRASRGRWLIDRCWGNYVAILRSEDPNRASILKDPIGALPCYVTVARGVLLIFSFAEDLVRLGLCRFTPNRAYLRAHAVHGADLRLRSLNEIDQIHRGECVVVDVENTRVLSRQFFWHPRSFIDTDEIFEDPDVAAKAMRATVRMCTHSLAAVQSNILLRLSGGLDSSIVAGCLKDAPSHPYVVCYTYFNPGTPSDERPWARLVTKRLNLEHREIPLTWENVDLRRGCEVPLLVEPSSILMYTLRSTIEQAIASDTNASAVFNGGGGDSGFGAEAARYAASEYARRRGLSLELLRIAAQVAVKTQQSTWGVLWGAISPNRDEYEDPVIAARLDFSRLCSRDVLAEKMLGGVPFHPWFAGEPRTPWATVGRLGMLLGSPQFYDVNVDDAPEVVSPLYAQPVTETLLRIPLYRLFEDGRDRGLARRAFAREVPEPILNRLWKDRAPGFAEQIVFQNRAFLREMFLDGLLLREGLLDRMAIEQTFADLPLRRQAQPAEIMRLFELEVWARAWESSERFSDLPHSPRSTGA